MSVWLTIIGTGDKGLASLPATSHTLIEAADIIVAPSRILETLPDVRAEIHCWSPPLQKMVETISGWRGRNTVILATGDPTYYGIGNTMVHQGVPLEETRMIPAPSAFSLACAQLGWAQQDVETVSLHGRPVELVLPLIQPNAQILALTAGETTIHTVSKFLMDRGFRDSRLTILEHMDGEKERIVDTCPPDATKQSFAPFNTLAIECVAGPNASILPRSPGLPDDAFIHDGQLTKREVRAATLAALSPYPGALLWDVGAGCGSIAIEWCRAATNAVAVCFEQNLKRAAMIADNAAALGVPHIHIVPGPAPETMSIQDCPDAVFIGGGLSDPALFERCWEALKPGGRMVANVVTIEGEARLTDHFKTDGGNLIRIAISRARPLGGMTAFKPLAPVTQWQKIKPMNGKKS